VRGGGLPWHGRCSYESAGGSDVAVAPARAESQQGPRRPPQAALDACESKAAGDACQVALPDRTLTGTCAATPEGTLVCRPDHPPGPPPEMTRACEGKADGDSCTLAHDDHQEQGVCRKGGLGALMCLP
jgi:hypothetical protein